MNQEEYASNNNSYSEKKIRSYWLATVSPTSKQYLISALVSKLRPAAIAREKLKEEKEKFNLKHAHAMLTYLASNWFNPLPS